MVVQRPALRAAATRRFAAPLCTAAAPTDDGLAEVGASESTDVLAWLDGRVQAALVDSFGAEYASAKTLVTPATKLEFGDYQCNVSATIT